MITQVVLQYVVIIHGTISQFNNANVIALKSSCGKIAWEEESESPVLALEQIRNKFLLVRKINLFFLLAIDSDLPNMPDASHYRNIGLFPIFGNPSPLIRGQEKQEPNLVKKKKNKEERYFPTSNSPFSC